MDKIVVLYDYKKKKQLISKSEETPPTPNENLMGITDEETKKAMERIGQFVDRNYQE